LSEEALRLARSLDDANTLASVLLARDYTITGPENVAERFANTTEVLAIAERMGDPVLASRALGLRFKASIESADVAEAERCVARNQAVIPDLGQPALTWATLHHEATLRVLRDEPGAPAAVDAAHNAGTSTWGQAIATMSLAHRLALRLDHGGLEGMIDATRGALQHVGRTRQPMAKAIYAFMLAETGQTDVASVAFDEIAATDFFQPTNNVAWLRFAADCAWVAARLERKDSVPELWSRLEPYADQLIMVAYGGGVSGNVAFYLGLLATTVGDWAEADARFGAAEATHERIGAPTWLARTRLEWGRMLLSRSGPGDRKRAERLLRLALDAARDRSLPSIERDAAALLSGA
jgi:hypothetical protein